MSQQSSLTPLEWILIGFVALGIFFFLRACWLNIQRTDGTLSKHQPQP